MMTQKEWRDIIRAEANPIKRREYCHRMKKDALAEAAENPSPEGVKPLKAEIEFYKAKWHEARRYLRQANKGAERNNMVMQLQAADINRLMKRIKELEQRP